MAAIIFDFDGTIADTGEYFITFIARQAGIGSLSEERRKSLRRLPLAAVARQLGHPWWRLPGLYYKGRRAIEPHILEMHPFEGMPEVLRKVHAEGHELFIISSNSAKNISRFLKKYKMEQLFFEIYGGVFLFSKASVLRKLMKRHAIELKDAIYIGDELRDMQAAQSLKMRAIGVTWGFSTVESLKSAKPTALADTPDELLKILEEV